MAVSPKIIEMSENGIFDRKNYIIFKKNQKIKNKIPKTEKYILKTLDKSKKVRYNRGIEKANPTNGFAKERI